jgi:hypothetical protein
MRNELVKRGVPIPRFERAITEEVIEAAPPWPKLPKELAGAKPRYNIGMKSYEPVFESDVDRALFIVAQQKKSAANDQYLAFLRATGMSDEKIAENAATVRARLKEILSNENPGRVSIPEIIKREPIKRTVTRPAPVEAAAAEDIFEPTVSLPTGQKARMQLGQKAFDLQLQINDLEKERALIEKALAAKKVDNTQAVSLKQAINDALSEGNDLSLDLIEDTPEGAARAAELEPQVSLKRELREVNKQMAESLRQASSDYSAKLENAFVNTYNYWGDRNSSARVVAERSLGAAGKAVNQSIREQYAVASGLISQTIHKSRKAVAPDERFFAILELVGDQHGYGAAWKSAQEANGLTKEVVESMALAYFKNPEAVKNQAKPLFEQLKETVINWDKSPQELADELLDMSRISVENVGSSTPNILVENAPKNAELQIAAGDYQFTRSVMAQSIVDSALHKASNVGLTFSADQAKKMVAAFRPPGSKGMLVSDADLAEGRRLALLSMETAVDHQRPLTQPYVFGRGAVLTSGQVNRPAVVSAAKKVGKVKEVEDAATAGEAVTAMMDGVDDLYRGQIYIPDAIRQELDRAVDQLIASSRGGAQSSLASTYKRSKIYGLLAPRTKFYWDQTTQESDNIALALGVNDAVKSGIHSVLPTMFALPGVSVATGFVDVVREARGGTTGVEALNKVQDLISMAPFGYQTTKAMGASEEAIEGMLGVTYAEINRIGLGRGVQNAPEITDLNRSLEEAFREPISRMFAEPSPRRIYEGVKGAAATMTVDVTKELGTAITERRRWGTMMMLFEERVAQLRKEGQVTRQSILDAADEAARAATEIHMDYNATIHPVERDFLESMFFPFWSFEKSNLIRVARQVGTRGERYLGAIESAREGYRFGRWTRTKKDLVEMASFAINPADDHGFDVEAMEDDDEATAASMRKDGKSEEEIAAAMMLPQYKAIVQQAQATGVEAWQVRNNLSWDTDPRLTMFAPFMDYYIAPAPRSLVPDKYSELKAPFSVIQADSRLRSTLAYDRMMNDKVKMGAEQSYTMWMLPEDSNLAILARPMALQSVVSSFMVNGFMDPAAKQRALGAVLDLTGDPFGFNPLGQALANALLADQGVSKTTTQPVKLDDASGELLMKLMPAGAVTRVNKPTKWQMVDADGGTVEVDAEVGYYVSPQTAPMLGLAMISYLDGLGQAERVNGVVTGLSMLMDDSTADEGMRRLTRSVGIQSKKADITKMEITESQQYRGRLARLPSEVPGATTEVVQTVAGAALEQYQRGQKQLENPQLRTDALLQLGGKSDQVTSGVPGMARVLLKELGVITEEQAKSMPNEDIIKAAADPRARAASREAGQAEIERLDQRGQAVVVKNVIKAAAGNYAKPDDIAKARYLLVKYGGRSTDEVDAMSGEDIIRTFVRSQEGTK